MEQVLIDLITDDPAGQRLIDRFLEVQYKILARTLEAAKGGFQIMWLGEDLGTQNSAHDQHGYLQAAHPAAASAVHRPRAFAWAHR